MRSRLKEGERGKKVNQTTGTEENGEDSEDGRVGGMRRIEQRDGRFEERILALGQRWEARLFLGERERERRAKELTADKRSIRLFTSTTCNSWLC
jgi:hypothetical protein